MFIRFVFQIGVCDFTATHVATAGCKNQPARVDSALGGGQKLAVAPWPPETTASCSVRENRGPVASAGDVWNSMLLFFGREGA